MQKSKYQLKKERRARLAEKYRMPADTPYPILQKLLGSRQPNRKGERNRFEISTGGNYE